jgi:hypothetical protein
MTTPSFVAGLSQVRPERLIEENEFRQCKQRRVDILTKSSLRLPINRTGVYIQQDFKDHEREIEIRGKTGNRSKENRREKNGVTSTSRT